MKSVFQLSALKIGLIYLFLGFIWIYISDYLALIVFSDSIETQRFIQTTKGWFFVTISAFVIYALVHRFKSDIENTKLSKIESLQHHLKEKNVLLAEVHHRVKNNLAIISSLLQLQADKAPEAMKLISEMNVCRIKSMALIHELLYQSENYATIDMNSYCEKLINILKSKFSKEFGNVQLVYKSSDSIQLDLNRAIPVGIIASEAISNAYIHAFSEVENGTIQVDLSQIENQLILSVIDDGAGFNFSTMKTVDSLGINLIEGLANQIDAKSKFETIPGSGTKYELIINL
jgi:two-component sensor histidine kinase